MAGKEPPGQRIERQVVIHHLVLGDGQEFAWVSPFKFVAVGLEPGALAGHRRLADEWLVERVAQDFSHQLTHSDTALGGTNLDLVHQPLGQAPKEEGCSLLAFHLNMIAVLTLRSTSQTRGAPAGHGLEPLGSQHLVPAEVGLEGLVQSRSQLVVGEGDGRLQVLVAEGA